MKGSWRPRLVIAAFHLVLFVVIWIHWLNSGQPLFGGLPGTKVWAGVAMFLFIVDLPFSAVGIAIDWGMDKIPQWLGGVVWGGLGTLWWYFLSGRIDTWIHRRRSE
jgi:hypothetical protein